MADFLIYHAKSNNCIRIYIYIHNSMFAVVFNAEIRNCMRHSLVL